MQEMSPVDETFRLGATEWVLGIRTHRIFNNSEGKWHQVHHHGSLNDAELPACHHPAVLVRR